MKGQKCGLCRKRKKRKDWVEKGNGDEWIDRGINGEGYLEDKGMEEKDRRTDEREMNEDRHQERKDA